MIFQQFGQQDNNKVKFCVLCRFNFVVTSGKNSRYFHTLKGMKQTILYKGMKKVFKVCFSLMDPETREKDDQGSQAQYMARLKKVGSEMFIDMTKVATSKIYSLLFKGVGGDDPATVYIPQDPACALEVMRSLH